MNKFKIKEIKLYNGKIIYTIYFKKHTEEQKRVEDYLDSINAVVISTTYLENEKGYIDYYLKEEDKENE